MDDEIQEIVKAEPWTEIFDIDYEFDAPRFFDFCRIETESEVREAERWFQLAGNYPPSRLMYHYERDRDNIPKATMKPRAKSLISKTSTLMKPTACQLARQNRPLDVHSLRLLRRCQRSLCQFSDTNSSTISSSFSNIKRQKLEAGFLKKIYGVDDLALLVHKAPRKVGLCVDSANGRPNITIPRQPELLTARRAERHRSKLYVNSVGHQLNCRTSEIVESSSCPTCQQGTSRLQDFKSLHLRKLDRALRRRWNEKTCSLDGQPAKNGIMPSAGVKIVETLEGKKSKECDRCKCRKGFESKATPSRCREEEPVSNRSSQDESIEELFSKLSLNLEANYKPRMPLIAEKVANRILRTRA